MNVDIKALVSLATIQNSNGKSPSLAGEGTGEEASAAPIATSHISGFATRSDGAGEEASAAPIATPVTVLTIGDLIEQLRTVAERTEQEFARDCTLRGEIGAAELLTRITRNWVAFDLGSLQWHVYNGLYWQPDNGGNVKILASKTLAAAFKTVSIDAYSEKLEAEAAVIDPKNKTQEEIGKIAALDNIGGQARAKMKSMHDIAAVKRVLEFAQAGHLLGVDSNVWDKQTHFLGVANGLVDLRTGNMAQPSYDQYVRTVAPVNFVSGATCPTFERAIAEIFDNDADKIAYVQRSLGYAMSGECTESDFPIWYGQHGRNGKEFILERVLRVLGDKLASPIDSELLLSSKAQRNKNGSTESLMVLRGLRIAWASESNEGRSFDSATMKDLTGGHILTGRHNHGRQEQWERTHTLFMLTNHKPHMSGGGGDAEWERAKLLEFTQSFVSDPDPTKPYQHQKDGTLGKRIDDSELPGVFNWLIAGCLEWRKVGLATPQCVKGATESYRKEEDNIGEFIDDCCDVGVNHRCTAMKIYGAYKSWADDMGDRNPMRQKAFLKRIREKGFGTSEIVGKVTFSGIGLKSASLPEGM